MYNELKQIWKW